MAGTGFAFADTTILNVSYDPTRELYKEYNAAFAAHWKAETGETVTIQQSHGGSGKQARAVIDGLDADVVTLALESDINAIVEESKKINPDWRTQIPEQFVALHLDDRLPRPQGQSERHQRLGRPGQGRRPGHHAEPEDLRRRALELSRRLGLGQRQVRRRRGQDQGIRRQSLRPCSGARHRRARLDRDLRRSASIGDVLLAWENEAYLALDEFGADNFDIVCPADLDPRRAAGRGGRRQCRRQGHAQGRRSLSQLPLFDGRPDDHRPSTTIVRPSPNSCRPKTLQKLPEIKLVTIDDPIFGGWAKAQPYHFGDGGIFDQIYKPAPIGQDRA